MKLDNRLTKLEEVVGEDVECSYEEAAELLVPILKADQDGSPLPCSAAKARAVIKLWMDECARQPPMVFKQEIKDDD